jgi:hypothetical protein
MRGKKMRNWMAAASAAALLAASAFAAIGAEATDLRAADWHRWRLNQGW